MDHSEINQVYEPNETSKLLNFPFPKIQKQIKSFHGMCGLYKNSINNWAKIIRPLTSCLKKEKKVEHIE